MMWILEVISIPFEKTWHVKDIVLPEKIREMQITMDLGKVFPKMEDFEYCCETNRVIIKFNNNQDTYRGFKDGKDFFFCNGYVNVIYNR